MLEKRPLLLLSNDDGFESPGLRTLRRVLQKLGDVVVVAPETEQSAASHALSLHRPLRLRQTEPGIFALDGTPADCVYTALAAGTRVLPRLPDAVVSGLNRGLNLGLDVFYSGTVAAAREGALRGISAVAASAHPSADREAACALTVRVVERLLARPSDAPTLLLNVNFPRAWGPELRGTRLGSRIYEQTVDFRVDPRGREYLWVGGPGVRHVRAAGTDTDAYDDGVVSITPLVLDLTARDAVDETQRITFDVERETV